MVLLGLRADSRKKCCIWLNSHQEGGKSYNKEDGSTEEPHRKSLLNEATPDALSTR